MGYIDTGVDGWRDATAVALELATDPPDAVLCYDDKLAMTLLDALRSTHLDVPGDLALVGFDGISAAHQSRPRLTTVDVPSADVGRRAVDMLVAATREGTMPPSEMLPVRLVIGDSTPAKTASRRGDAPREMVGSRRGSGR